jgi:hypothetical protein
MPPLGKFLRRIAPAATMFNEFKWNKQNTNKTQLLASNYGTFWLLVVCENFVPQHGPSTQVIDVMSCVQMWDNTIWAEELVNISSYQKVWGGKKRKSY